MARRGVTVLVGAALVALMVWGVVAAPVPYVTLGPGPTVDTLGTADGHEVIEVGGVSTPDAAGQLRLVTVSVADGIWLIDAIRGWLDGEDAVLPRELVYPPGQTQQQVEEQNARDFQASQTSAETAALRELGFAVHVTVTEVVKGAPAEGRLVAGDEITSVDGEAVTSTVKLQELVRAKPARTALTVRYLRGGQAASTTITATAGEDGAPRLGIVVENRQRHPYEIKIDLGAQEIGGPSAGLMFALGIVEKIEPADLTGGVIIAGTGTIDEEGRVGPIGGVAQKLIAAKRARAGIFLTPAANCEEALGSPQPGLRLAKVATLDDALGALRALREGREPTLCGAQ